MHDQRHGSPELSATERGHALPESTPARPSLVLHEQVDRALRTYLNSCGVEQAGAVRGHERMHAALEAACGDQVRDAHECRMVGYAHGYMAREPIHEWLEKRLTYLERALEAARRDATDSRPAANDVASLGKADR